MQSHKYQLVRDKQLQGVLLVVGVLLVELCVSHCRAQDIGDWYPFAPRNTTEPGEIGMQDWLEKPAGVHGRLVRRDDKLFYNGRAVKLWGLNNTYSTCAPAKELADKRAAFYPKYGINSVRLHKYADGTGWAGIQSAETVSRLGAEVVVTGHCGPKALRTLRAAGIRIVTGAQGTVKEAVDAFNKGALKYAEAPDVESHWA